MLFFSSHDSGLSARPIWYNSLWSRVPLPSVSKKMNAASKRLLRTAWSLLSLTLSRHCCISTACSPLMMRTIVRFICFMAIVCRVPASLLNSRSSSCACSLAVTACCFAKRTCCSASASAFLQLCHHLYTTARLPLFSMRCSVCCICFIAAPCAVSTRSTTLVFSPCTFSVTTCLAAPVKRPMPFSNAASLTLISAFE